MLHTARPGGGASQSLGDQREPPKAATPFLAPPSPTPTNRERGEAAPADPNRPVSPPTVHSLGGNRAGTNSGRERSDPPSGGGSAKAMNGMEAGRDLRPSPILTMGAGRGVRLSAKLTEAKPDTRCREAVYTCRFGMRLAVLGKYGSLLGLSKKWIVSATLQGRKPCDRRCSPPVQL